jgi:ABC-type dipeptide/oligopeptide/nickel transport system ATPase component
VLLCDEPTSALDVSVQAAILELLLELRKENGIALAVITHNLDVVRVLCEDIVVMHEGVVVEAGATSEVFANPSDSYTRMLLDSVPTFAYGPFSGLPAEVQREAQDIALQRRLVGSLG